jgi:hypothetical protein
MGSLSRNYFERLLRLLFRFYISPGPSYRRFIRLIARFRPEKRRDRLVNGMVMAGPRKGNFLHLIPTPNSKQSPRQTLDLHLVII